MVRISLKKMKNKFKLNEDKKKKLTTWITITCFLFACLFMAFRDSNEAEASALSLVGYFPVSSRGIAGAYLSSTGKIYLNGGWASTANFFHLYEFDPATNNVQQNTATFDDLYPFAACGALGDGIYFLGGLIGGSQSFSATNKIFKFTPDSITLVGNLPEPRMWSAYATYNGAIYMAGGDDNFISDNVNYSDILKYDGQTVTRVGEIPVPLYGAAAEFIDGKMLIFGGWQDYQLSYGAWTTRRLNTIYQFDPQTGQCLQVGNLPYSCGGLSAARVGGSIYLFLPGGSDWETNITEIYEYYQGHLYKLSVMVPEALYSTCTVAVGTKIYLFCGRTNSTILDTSHIWVLDTAQIPPGTATLSVSQEGNTITLTWDPVLHTTQYHIEHSSDGSNWTEIAVTTNNSYTGTLTGAGKHYYRVRAENNGVFGEYSNVVTVVIKPSSPAGLQTSVDGKTVSLSWQAVPDASSYIVQRSTDGNTWTQIAEVSGTSYTDTNTNWNTSYYYRVLSKTSDGVTSDPSNAVQVTTSKIPAPTNLKASLNGTKVTLTWQPVSGASSYVVERSLDGKTWSAIATVTSSSYVDQNTQQNTVYYYRVRSQCSTSVSDPSNTVAVQTFEDPPPPPPVISGLTAIWNGDRIRVTWNRGQNQLPDGEIELWKQGSNGVWLPVKTLSVSDRDSFVWDDLMIAPGQNYRYELRYLGGLSTGYTWYKVAESGWATGDRPMAAPGGLRVSLGQTSATVTWEAVSGASSYTVQYSTDGGTTWQSFTVTGTSANVPRYCLARVRAGSHSRSQWSGIVTVN